MSDNKKYYMVFVDGHRGRKPKVKYNNLTRAVEEANRLALLEKRPTLILEIIGQVEVEGEKTVITEC